jgi:hypothetical protein
MQLKDALNLMKFDVRLVELYLKSGQITKAEYEKYLANLEDDAALATKADADDEGYDDEDDDLE